MSDQNVGANFYVTKKFLASGNFFWVLTNCVFRQRVDVFRMLATRRKKNFFLRTTPSRKTDPRGEGDGRSLSQIPGWPFGGRIILQSNKFLRLFWPENSNFEPEFGIECRDLQKKNFGMAFWDLEHSGFEPEISSKKIEIFGGRGGGIFDQKFRVPKISEWILRFIGV